MRRRVAALAALALAGSALLLGAVPASAHNSVVAVSPAKDSTVTTQPGTVAVTTSDNLLGDGENSEANAMTVQDAAGTYYGEGCATVSGPALSMPVQLGAAGTYTVTWQVVSADGHPVSGDFSFEWAPEAGQSLAEGSATRPVCGQAPAAGSDVAATPGAGESATPAPSASATAVATAPAGNTDLAWLLGGLLVVIAAIAVVLITALRSRAKRDGTPGADSAGTPPTDPAE